MLSCLFILRVVGLVLCLLVCLVVFVCIFQFRFWICCFYVKCLDKIGCLCVCRLVLIVGILVCVLLALFPFRGLALKVFCLGFRVGCV